jgi:hypothetical protein
MLDYPKLEMKKGGKVKKLIQKQKQKQIQRQVVNVNIGRDIKKSYARRKRSTNANALPQLNQSRMSYPAPMTTIIQNPNQPSQLPDIMSLMKLFNMQGTNTNANIPQRTINDLRLGNNIYSSPQSTSGPLTEYSSGVSTPKLVNIINKNPSNLTKLESDMLSAFNNMPSFSQTEKYDGDEYADIGKRGRWEGLSTSDITKILALENPERLPPLPIPPTTLPTREPISSTTLIPPFIPPPSPFIPLPPPMIPPPPPISSTTLPTPPPISSATLPAPAPILSTTLKAPEDFLESIKSGFKSGFKLKPTKKEEAKEESKKSSSSNPILDAIKTGIKLKPKEEQLPIKPKEEAKKVSSNPMLDIIKAGLSGRRSVIKDDEEDWNDEPAIQEFKTPTKGDLNQLINRLGASGLKPTVKGGSNPYESGYKNYYVYALVNKHGYSINSVINLTQAKLAELLKAKG